MISLTSVKRPAAASFLYFNCLRRSAAFKPVQKRHKKQIANVSTTDLLHVLQKKGQIHRNVLSVSRRRSPCVLPQPRCAFKHRFRAPRRADVVPFKKKWSRNENMMWLCAQFLFAASSLQHRREQPVQSWKAFYFWKKWKVTPCYPCCSNFFSGVGQRN